MAQGTGAVGICATWWARARSLHRPSQRSLKYRAGGEGVEGGSATKPRELTGPIRESDDIVFGKRVAVRDAPDVLVGNIGLARAQHTRQRTGYRAAIRMQ